jgi:small-conductance mechanosensitive channel
MNLLFLIPIGLITVGVFIFLFNIFKAYRKNKAIKHYEKIRDKLTLREPEPEPESGDSGGFSISSLIGGFITVVIGVMLIPTIAEQVPVVFAIAIMLVGIAVAYNALRRGGLA